MRRSPTTKYRRLFLREGATTVEMALVLPVFFAVVFGCLEFSKVSMVRSQIANATYEAARFAMVQGSGTDDAEESVDRTLALHGIRGAVTTVRFQDEGQSAVGPGEATRVNVQVDVPYSQNGFLAPYLPESFANLTLTSQVTLRTNLHSPD